MNGLQSCVSAAEQEKAATDLLQRILPHEDYVSSFRLTVNPSLASSNDTVTIRADAKSNAIEVEGSSGVAVSWGIQRYLRVYCNCHFSWDGFQVALPGSLPLPSEPLVDTARVKLRYLSNVCTFSYSYAWWGWDRWERYIDWMVLNGLNFPLAHTGQEAVWRAVWHKLGLSFAEIDDYFTGPGFLAWHRMGNLRKWGGPLSENWHQQQTELQTKILDRMTSFGMIPILPAFSGFVPPAFIEHFPNAKTTKLSRWGMFDECYTGIDFLDPLDPLFKEIGTLFMNEMRSVFGLYHAYSADCFNEVDPATFNSEYLSAVSKSVYSVMAEVDPDAVWVMQGWLFQFDTVHWIKEKCEALLTAVPMGHLLVLDLYAEEKPKYEKLDNFFGQPFVWNMLHNFGGVSSITGNVNRTRQSLEKSFEVDNMVGVGLTMEGIHQNYVLYQMVLDSCWSSYSGEASQWYLVMLTRLDDFVTQRYGQTNSTLQAAWTILWDSVYVSPPPKPPMLIPTQNCLFKRPRLLREHQLWFEPQQMFDVFEQFVSQSQLFEESSLFQRDLIEVAREVLNLIALAVYRETTAIFLSTQTCIRKGKRFSAKDTEAVRKGKVKFETVFRDLDQLLSFDESFLLGTWIKNARKLAPTEEEADQNEENARYQVTIWGPCGEVVDYAAKQWSGLIELYYLPRWSLFFEGFIESLETKSLYSELKYQENAFHLIEEPFATSKAPVADKRTSGLAEFAQGLFEKYSSELDYVTRVLMTENDPEKGARAGMRTKSSSKCVIY